MGVKLLVANAPLAYVVHGSRQPALQPLGARPRPESGIACLDDPGEELAGATVQIWRRRHRHEHSGESLLERQVVEDMSELLHDVPCQGVMYVDGELHPPPAALVSAMPNRPFDCRNACEIRKQLREGPIIHD